MRRALFAALCAVLFAVPVLAEDGPVCLYSDASGSTCDFTDSGGIMEFYVIHTPDAGVAAMQFAAPVPGCMTGASWIGDLNSYLAIGNSQTGMSVAYAGCLTGPILVTTIQVATVGLTSSDCPYPVIPDPGAPTGFIEVVDCSGNKHLGTGGTAYINSTLDCKCGPGPGDPILDASPLVVTFGENDDAMPLAVSNIGAGILTWEVLESLTWLTAGPTSGAGDHTITLAVNRFGLQTGHYTETLWVASSGGNATITIELEVGANPILGVNPTSLTFGETDVLKNLTVFNAGTGPITWSIDPPVAGWLSIDPSNGVGTTRVDVSVNRTGLPVGVYNASLHVTSDGGDADVPVQMVVGAPPLLGYNPGSLDYGLTQTLKFLNVFNAGDGLLSWTVTPLATWVSAFPTGGTGDATIAVEIDRTGLPPGSHSTLVNISSNGGNASVPVTMQIPAPVPVLGLSPTAFTLGASQTQQFLQIFNAGTGTLFWDVASNVPWMSVFPDSGVDGGLVTVTVDRTGLGDGTYNGTVHVTSNGGNADVAVTMIVDNTPTLNVAPVLLVFDSFTTVRTFAITNLGGGTLSWQMSADRPWISIDPPHSGTGNAAAVVRVNPANVPGPGIQTGNVTVTSNGGIEMIEVRFVPPGTGGPAGAVTLYSDPAFTNCAITDIPGLVSVYVVHELHPGASAIQFSAPMPSCWTGAVYLTDNNPFPLVIGNSQDGMAVSYQGCFAGQVHVTTMLFFSQGAAGPCCSYEARPDPSAPSGQIEGVDCALSRTYPNAGSAVINPTGYCPCGYLISVETKTWGGVKALYAPAEEEGQ